MPKEEESLFQKITAGVIIVGLIILLFFTLRPILLSIIFGLILGFILSPLYRLIHKKIKSKNVSATITCVLVLLIIVVPFIFLFPTIINQVINSYNEINQLDISAILKTLFSKFIDNDSIYVLIEDSFKSAISNITNSLLGSLTIKNITSFSFQCIVLLFITFFTLKGGEEISNQIKSLLPFSKEVQQKLFKSSREITFSIVYGQIIIGLIQGILLGIDFFIFSVPNAFFLTLLAMVVGILPVLGPSLIWIPVLIYLLITGNVPAVIGTFIFGIISSNIENIIRPLFLSKKTNLSSPLALVGTIGGWLFLGVAGIVLGPLIIAYFLIIIEAYKNKPVPGLIVEGEKNGT